ncbi:phosphocarrier protein HPr [Neokomagataea thailandica NBRC 106555]|uniref:HPr family phosphocarrier protein n=2 Tax=Neokomagataea TaxID=1223423 RepID=A0A4Y6V8Y2_9PROT|nr:MULTISPECIES: HPr family phosphocarrier protein [Neokomagataea]QDH24976.1 HPr family phosphocarrier protein [Neokomagataea tanensis]GBR51576.1 phosphocarrier protein HPr [Neokomagataea thailandica NBRC 106555]
MSQDLFVRELRIVNRLGLHARAAAKLVTTAEGYEAETTVERAGNVVSALSIMGLMMLGAGEGETILVRSHGQQAREALEAVVALISDGFGERD